MHKREVISTVINYDACGSGDITVTMGDERQVIEAGKVSGDGKITHAFNYKKLNWQVELSGDLDEKTGKFSLSVNGTRQDGLPTAIVISDLCSSDCFAV